MVDPAQPIRLSVVIPAYNEAKNIQEAMRRVAAYMTLKKYSWELIVVSDGSRDETDRMAKEYIAENAERDRFKLLTSEKNHGKGYASRQGILAAKGKYILLTDTDLSSPIKEVDKLISSLEAGADIAIGSRAVREAGADVQQSVKRRLSGRIFNFFVRLFVIRGIKDTQCGFKCFKKEAARTLFEKQKLDGFAFDVEILYLAKKTGFKIREVPVMWKQGADSRVSLFRDSFVMLGDLLRIKKLHP